MTEKAILLYELLSLLNFDNDRGIKNEDLQREQEQSEKTFFNPVAE